MTTELTLREKAMGVPRLADYDEWVAGDIIDQIADLLSATGAPAYIRVADDLRGVVREEGPVWPSLHEVATNLDATLDDDQKILDEGRNAITKPPSHRTKSEWAAIYLVPFIEARARGESE